MSSSLEDQIVAIVRNQVNASRGLTNLSGRANRPELTKSVVNVIRKHDAGPALVRVVPANLLANSISKMILNGIVPPPKVSKNLAQRIIKTQPVETILKVLNGDLGRNMARTTFKELPGKLKPVNEFRPPVFSPERRPTNEFRPSERRPTNEFRPPNFVETVYSVPGGIHELAMAAEALNETNGNVRQASEIKGASPLAISAVRSLGGYKNTMKILHSLRPTELNRVLKAVKKQKLISLTAHDITRTHNIHPEDERLKPYYVKLVRSYLKNTPFWKIAKRAQLRKKG